MQKLDFAALSTVSGGGGTTTQATNGGIAITGDNNVVNYGNTSFQSSNSGSSRKS